VSGAICRGCVGIERERLDETKPGDLQEAFNLGKAVSPEQALRNLNLSLTAGLKGRMSFARPPPQAGGTRRDNSGRGQPWCSGWGRRNNPGDPRPDSRSDCCRAARSAFRTEGAPGFQFISCATCTAP